MWGGYSEIVVETTLLGCWSGRGEILTLTHLFVVYFMGLKFLIDFAAENFYDFLERLFWILALLYIFKFFGIFLDEQVQETLARTLSFYPELDLALTITLALAKGPIPARLDLKPQVTGPSPQASGSQSPRAHGSQTQCLGPQGPKTIGHQWLRPQVRWP